MKKHLKRVLSLFLSLIMVITCMPIIANAETTSTVERYSVLILDDSGSMDGTPQRVQKQAAKKFCSAVLSAKGVNKVAIVRINSSSQKMCDFTNDLSVLNSKIDSLSSYGGTNIYSALSIANSLLSSAPENAIKNIVLCSDGLPQSGNTSSSGPYTSSDSSYYSYANAVYTSANNIMSKGINMYSLGFFHSLTNSTLAFARRFMSDIQNKGYYDVTNIDDLEFTFGEIAEKLVEVHADFISDKVSFNGDNGYYYRDSYFLKDSTTYNQSLATMSLCLAFSTYASNKKYETYDSNVYKIMNECGFTDDNRYVQYSFHDKPEKNSVACAIGSKILDDCTLIAVAVRSGGYEAEWGSNLDMGQAGDHYGFDSSSDKVYTRIQNYISSRNITGRVKVWITGYSRGAAVATQAAAKLDDSGGLAYVVDGAYQTANIKKEDVYAYGFATPAGAVKSSKPNSNNYNNIFNIIEYNDPVPLVAPSDWDMTRYGITKILPYRESTNSKEYSKYINELKKRMGSDYMVDNFINYATTFGGGSYPAFYNKDTLGTYNRKLINALASSIGGRKKYSEKYENDLSKFIADYQGNGDIDVGLVISHAVSLVSKMAIFHPNLTDTLLMNLHLIADVHANQKYYLYWMQILDPNYKNNIALKSWKGYNYRLVKINCPVDVTVYNKDKEIVAQIIDEVPIEIKDSTIISSIDENDQKIFYLPVGEEFDIDISARENSNVSVGVEEYECETGNLTRVVSFDKVNLNENDTLIANIDKFSEEQQEQNLENGSSADYDLSKNGQKIAEQFDARGADIKEYSLTIDYNQNMGTVIGEGNYAEGSFVKLSAEAKEGYSFEGFYIGNTEIIDDDLDNNANTVRVQVNSNMNITAKFNSLSSGTVTQIENEESKPIVQEEKTVVSPKTFISKLTAKKNAFKAVLNKVAGVDGYQIQYSRVKDFSKSKKTITTKNSSKTIKVKKPGKKYYVRARTYKIVDGKKIYSKWSKVKTVKTK